LHAANNNSFRNTQAPGSELFPEAGSSYIPSGLTKEQYAKIKKKEQTDQKKKDLGAWGPRFAKSERPNGDWMTLPSLWTGGFDGNRRNNGLGNGNAPGGGAAKMDPILMGARVKRLLPIYMLACLLVECVFTAMYLFHKKEAASLFAMAALRLKHGQDALLFSAAMVAKINGIKLLVAAPLLVKPLELLIERCNRRLFWSPRRTMVYSALGSVGSISLLRLFMILVLRRFV